MALTNSDRIDRAFSLLSEGLLDLVDPVMTEVFHSEDWPTRLAEEDARKYGGSPRPLNKFDPHVQLRVITERGRAFSDVLSRSQQAYASELREVRNLWAHKEPFSSEQVLRALDTMVLLLRAANAPDSATDVESIKQELQRTMLAKQVDNEYRRRTVIKLGAGDGLTPWRELVHPHDEITQGRFAAAEFAADLHTVAIGENSNVEYSDPIAFFERTYLTEGLTDLLARALRRVSGQPGASPVVNLQTNFGGGKTHSMLALFHLFSGKHARDFPQAIQDIIERSGVRSEDFDGLKVRRVAIVGTSLSPASGSRKDDGTHVNTIWGELAWQLGGREAYDMIAADDIAGTSPGDGMRRLFERYGPALILIDEWVAYARQLVGRELPAGDFETQFSFAQTLAEAAAAVDGCMLLVSIPASDAAETENSGNDLEVGGNNGRLALQRLLNVIGRVADQWRPSTKNESFEIVRRRIFQDPSSESNGSIAAIAKAYVRFYQENPGLFPKEAATSDYEQRIRDSYPLHPELLDRLYDDWSSLDRFQRTRGVLNLVSDIVHELWRSNDQSALIQPGNVMASEARINPDLTQYLPDSWKPVIDSDIDGPESIPAVIDRERPNLGQRLVTQRLARTVFFGSAPRSGAKLKGVDRKNVWLGAAVPGDALGNFPTAVEQLSQRSIHFYEENSQYWFGTQASAQKTANEYAEQLRNDPETVLAEVTRRLEREFSSQRGDFARVHVAPETGADVPDTMETRLVVVPPRYTWRKNDHEKATAFQWITDALAGIGAQRMYKNTLVFLAADFDVMDRLESATRQYLGWRKVSDSAESLDLSAQQAKQSQEKVRQANDLVDSLLRDTYVWTVVPIQNDPSKPVGFDTTKLTGSGVIATAISDRLRRDDSLISRLDPEYIGDILTGELHRVWEQDGEVSVKILWEWFTKFPYMPRLKNRDVLDDAVEQALVDVTSRFAIARGKDSDGRYQGLVIPPENNVHFSITDNTLLVSLERAHKQVEAAGSLGVQENAAARADGSDQGANSVVGIGHTPPDPLVPRADPIGTQPGYRRYWASVELDGAGFSKQLIQINTEVLDHLRKVGARLSVRLEIQAESDQVFDSSLQRVVSENSSSLRFNSFDFEE